MDSQLPLLLKRTGNILTLSLNNPSKRNALNSELMGALSSALETIDNYPELRVVVIRGKGSVFCSGADVNNWEANELQSLLSAIINCPIPTIAAIHGVCLGGGMGLACSCDFILAQNDALFGFPEVRIGMVPAIISPYVNRKLSISKMRELFLAGGKIDASSAWLFGLLYEEASNNLDLAVMNLVTDIIKGGPKAQANIKKLLGSNFLSGDFSQRNSKLAKFISEVKASSESQEGIKSFLEKRKPSWRN